MGITICKIHGRTGLLPMCKHLHLIMTENAYPEKIITVTYNFGNFFGEQDCPMFMGFLYCVDCTEEYRLPEESCALPESECDSAPWDDITAACKKCFDEFLAKHQVVWNGFEVTSN